MSKNKNDEDKLITELEGFLNEGAVKMKKKKRKVIRISRRTRTEIADIFFEAYEIINIKIKTLREHAGELALITLLTKNEEVQREKKECALKEYDRARSYEKTLSIIRDIDNEIDKL